jgi:hypothetical protein
MSNESVKANLELLCDIKVFLGLACIIPMLECIRGFFKFVQTQDVFICDFVAIVKSCQGDLTGCIVMSKQDMGIMTLVKT